jgi:hypothetical protein
VVTNSAGVKLATIFGKWDDALYYVEGDPHEKKLEALSTSQLLWQRSPPAEPADRYGLSRFAITLNEITPGLQVGKHASGEESYFLVFLFFF